MAEVQEVNTNEKPPDLIESMQKHENTYGEGGLTKDCMTETLTGDGLHRRHRSGPAGSTDDKLYEAFDESNVRLEDPGGNNEHRQTVNESTSGKHVKDISLVEYFYAELTRGYFLEHDGAKFAERRERVYTFLKIPKEVERFMMYGFFQCVDAFLFVFTFLPLRVLLALARLSTCACFVFGGSRGRLLEPAQICDLLKGIILVVVCVLMNYVDVSMMYHLVRGQAIIKLYIFFNMLEVADKLFSSVGQDILDALFWTATEPRGRRREHLGTIPHLALAISYVFLHSILVLFQATTLNVAFNSHNKSLLTIMMSNNFVELKGSVFKKFAKNNLFQMACSDVRERFHFLVLLSIVCVRNLTELQWNMNHFWVLVPDVVLVLVAEVLVDWVKHAFITKFNEIPEEVYQEYTVSIAYDMASSRQKNANSDHLDLVSRRMGFIPLPMAALLVRIIWPTLKITSPVHIIILLLIYLCLTTFKIANSIFLLGKACDLIKDNKNKTKTEEKDKPPPGTPEASTGGILKRRHSFSSRQAQSVKFSSKDNDSLMRHPPVGSKPLFPSNSMVNLESVSLNEEFIKDSQSPKKTSVESGKGDTRKGPDTEKAKKVEKPLSEIDRYTMVSSHII